ncbi:MAG: type II toxin-antitoxin system PemK/MazF family toxin [Verrucomicrobia bacterium]|nr:type II toxin-antitoxin system PemK/MazF family toxin [Verrucomicrobiota bacterium]
MKLDLRQWDVVKVRINPQDRDEHPAIILSPNEITGGRADRLNVLYGTTKRPAVALLPGQILLDEADGCEHLTVFECTFFPVVKKEAIRARLGKVSPNRRRPLHQTIAAALRLFQ